MNLMKVRGSLTAWGGGAEPRRRRRPPEDAWGETTSSVAAAMAWRTLGSAGGVASLAAAASSGSCRPPSRRPRRGGGTAGTGIGCEASLEPTRTRVRLASWVATRLRGPLTGVRGVKILPTPGTGLPPTSREAENSQSCSPWNS